MTESASLPAADREEAVWVQNPARCRRIDLAGLDEWLRRLVAALAPDRPSLTLRLVGDSDMRRLNATFRGREKSTDVLSFPGDTEPGSRYLGDIAIAVPTARRQAAAQGHALSRELRILALHGVLHCLGHDHEVDDGQMTKLEEEFRSEWIPRNE